MRTIFAGAGRVLVPGLALLALLASLASPAAAIGIDLPCDRDNTLYESPTGGLSNGAGPTLFAGRTAQASNSIRRGLLHFDVAGAVPAGATIVSATLKLHLAAQSGGARTVTLHRVSAPWGEGTSNAGDSGGSGAPATPNDATWLHRFFDTTLWGTAGGDFVAGASASTSVADPGDYTWGSTAAMVADVQAWLDAPATNHGWLLRGDETVSSTSKRFESRESATIPLRPGLTLEYTVPVPAEAATWGRVKAGYR